MDDILNLGEGSRYLASLITTLDILVELKWHIQIMLGKKYDLISIVITTLLSFILSFSFINEPAKKVQFLNLLVIYNLVFYHKFQFESILYRVYTS